VIADVTDVFALGFKAFASAVAKGAVVRGIPAPGARQPRSLFDKLNDWAQEHGAAGSATSSSRPAAQGRSPSS
jgi:aspartyl-tRNA synthetase